MTKRAALFALLCAVVGFGASVAASYTHYHLLYDPTYRSFCDVSETISCTQVYASRYSTFQGIPVAIFGGLWFVVAAPYVDFRLFPAGLDLAGGAQIEGGFSQDQARALAAVLSSGPLPVGRDRHYSASEKRTGSPPIG